MIFRSLFFIFIFPFVGLTCCYSFTNECTDEKEASCFDGCKLILPGMKKVLKVFFLLLITITLINNYAIYKSIQYSTYITYSSIWHFWHRTEKRERKTTYNAFSKELIKDKTKIDNAKHSVVEHKTLKNIESILWVYFTHEMKKLDTDNALLHISGSYKGPEEIHTAPECIDP